MIVLTAGTFASVAPVGAAQRHAASHSSWVQSLSRRHVANVLLEAGASSENHGFNFDGYSKGKLRIFVPLNWRVNVTFRNLTPDLGHSAAIVPWSEQLTATAIRVAFPGASTPHPTLGSPTGQTVRFSFMAKAAGRYRIVCAVPGHANLGMWDSLIVQKGLRTARVAIG